nr:DNA-directed RNA polymerase II subunit RPB1-like [Crassostrea gigas]
MEDEDVILTNLRKEDPSKYEKLEKRIRGDGTSRCLGTSVGFKTTPTIIGYHSQSPENCTSQGFKTTTTTIPVYSSQSHECSTSQGFTVKTVAPTTDYPPQEPECTMTIPAYSPQSPEYSVSQGFTTAATTIKNPPPQSPECSTSRGFNVGFLQRLAGGAFPLQGELNALNYPLTVDYPLGKTHDVIPGENP